MRINITVRRWASEIKRLIPFALHLTLSGQFGLVWVALRRRLFGRFVSLDPIEYISEVEEPLEYFDGSSGADDINPLVSVIIPCFNYGSFVNNAIDSVLAQTLQSVEIIVVEGGSTDQTTTEVVRNLDRPRTTVIMQERPTLVGANRNRGIAAASGRYICCLDADDTLDPTYLEKAVYLLETHRYDVVSTGIRFAGTRTGTIDVLESPTLKDMTTGNHITTCAVFSRDLWKSAGGFTDTGKGQDHIAEDWDFWVKVAATGARMRNISGEHLFNYTIHEHGSLSSADGVQSRAKQGAAIMARNRESLLDEAFAKSTAAARRRMALSRAGGALLKVKINETHSRRLLIAVPYLIVGGAERLLSTVVRLLVSQGWRITVISTLPQEGHEDVSSWFKQNIAEVYMLPRFLKKWEQEGYVRYLIESRRFDALLLAGSRLIYDLLPVLELGCKDLAIIDLLFNTVGHTDSHIRLQKHITLAIGENPEVVSWLRATGRPESEIRLIESGVDASNFQTDRPIDLAGRLGIEDDEIVIGFSGRLSSEKSPEVFVEIAEALKDESKVCFVMTGDGPMRNAVEAKVRNLPLNVRFKFMGMVDDTEPYFALYDIFVLPSRMDGRPLALLEALSSGCAIVASNVGGIPAILEGTDAGILCAPGKAAAFAKAIRQLISNPQKLRDMKRAAANAAKERLSETRMANSYAEAIEAAILIKRQKNDLDLSVLQ
ncbi:glycosyltransferase [Rhizobium sp. BR 315]|uniref:glycosyltransferase n=1 Tax=Rhizobium sp. BR 315 TaxID=3040014 RepID=UPI003D356CC4